MGQISLLITLIGLYTVIMCTLLNIHLFEKEHTYPLEYARSWSIGSVLQ